MYCTTLALFQINVFFKSDESLISATPIVQLDAIALQIWQIGRTTDVKIDRIGIRKVKSLKQDSQDLAGFVGNTSVCASALNINQRTTRFNSNPKDGKLSLVTVAVGG